MQSTPKTDSMTDQPTGNEEYSAQTREAYRQVEHVMMPLLELFAVTDDVFTEVDAFSAEKRQASLGRIYRQWKRTRKSLDPDFDPKMYRRPRPAQEEQTSSSDQSLIFAKRKIAKPGKTSAKRSAKTARTKRHA